MGTVSYDFSGEVVLITGGGRGQGRSHALAFAAAGADVVICEIGETPSSVPYELTSSDELNDVAAEVEALGVRCQAAICDVRSSAQVKLMVDDAIKEFGKIDVLINNAGIESVSTAVDMAEETWDQMIDTQLKGTFLCSQQVGQHMVKARTGRIITTASTSSIVGAPRQTHYVAAKTGMFGFTKALALEMAEHDVTVNCVCPGGIDTPMVAGVIASKDPETASWLEQLGLLTGPWNLFDDGDLLAPMEITQAMMWLASEGARRVTGAAIVVDGGYTIK